MRRRSHVAISSTQPACRSSQRRRGPTARGDHATAALQCYARSAGRSRTSSKLLIEETYLIFRRGRPPRPEDARLEVLHVEVGDGLRDGRAII